MFSVPIYLLEKNAQWCHSATMNITLKDIPPPLHKSLKDRAKKQGRSLNKEVLSILETAVTPQRSSPQELLERIQKRRETMNHIVHQDELDVIINEGRA